MMKSPVYLVPFSHLDLFWAGSREECLTRGIEVIRTALRLLRKYPDYRFMIESANFLEFFCESCPDEVDELKRYADEGRLETVPLRSILYTQLPSGETLIRNCLRGRQIVLEKLGVCGSIATLSDIPGVTPQLPQIAAKCGFAGLFLSHGTPPHTDCVEYEAPDGTVIQTYAPIHYGRARRLFSDAADYETMCANEDQIEAELGGVNYPQLCQFGADLMVLKENVPENFQRWNRDGHRPFYFSTLTEFFAKHYRAKGRISGEIPSLWPNVESSWPDLWPADREAEAALFTAEYFHVLAPRFRKPEIMRQAWDWLLDAMDHNQNGIGGEIADRDKKALKETARMTAERLAHAAAVRIASGVGSPRQNAFPLVLFNRLSWPRRELVRARTSLYGATAVKMALLREENKFRLFDAAGKEHPFHLVRHLRGPADSVEIEFSAEVPAFGASCYYLEPGEPVVFESPFEVDDPRIEEKFHPDRYARPIRIKNAFWQLEIDGVTGDLSIADADGKLYVDRAGVVGLEEKRGDYICRMDLTGRRFPAVVNSISPVRISPVSAEIELTGTVYGLEFTQTIALAADSPELRITNKIQWKTGNFVRIEQAFPLAGDDKAEICYGVPFGMVRYPETIYKNGLNFQTIVTPERGSDPDDQIERIRLVSMFVSVNGLTIACDHRMWEFDEHEIRSCMVRGIGWSSGAQEILADGTHMPIRRPPDGEYVATYTLTPGSNPKAGWEAAAPLYPVGIGRSEPGPATLDLPVLPNTSGTSVIGSSVKPAEDGSGIVVRLFESEGQRAELSLPDGNWLETDMLEQNPVPVSGPLHFKPFEIKTLLKAHPQQISSVKD
ncbi:MAG: hypothetical protein J5806_09070 [Lentisphaeria bacterium]|nr:hypothetical protein [Lentisphaeria bacterium]